MFKKSHKRSGKSELNVTGVKYTKFNVSFGDTVPIMGNFGEAFNLVIWQLFQRTPNLKLKFKLNPCMHACTHSDHQI